MTREITIGRRTYSLLSRGKKTAMLQSSASLPKSLDTTCQHRGEPLGTINCGCGSVNRETEVFACQLKGACTLTALGGKAGWLKLDIKERPIYCATCEEREP